MKNIEEMYKEIRGLYRGMILVDIIADIYYYSIHIL